MKITILGCGHAPGVPSISSGWGRCDPANPRNRRRRSSIVVEEGGTRVLVDSSPDLREQLLDAGIDRLDGVVFTHSHADHIHGLDELREINRVIRGPLPIWAAAETLAELERRFGYAFEGIPQGAPMFRPWLIPNVIEPGQTFAVAGLPVEALGQDHGFSASMGYRFGEAVYSTDLVELPLASRERIRGVKVWIVGALRETPHETHAHLDRTLGWIRELKPHRALLTHMSHELDYETLISHRLPVGVSPAYDGMTIEI
jgi:phosphoribosyl 1,2-cyclic phosphate phosphodiesterase